MTKEIAEVRSHKSNAVWTSLLALSVAIAGCNSQTDSLKTKGASPPKSEDIALEGASEPISAQSDPYKSYEFVGSVPATWALYVGSLFDSRGIPWHETWSESFDKCQINVMRLDTDRVVNLLMFDSLLNSYSFEVEPNIAIGQFDSNVFIDKDRSYTWVESVVIEKGEYVVSVDVEDFKPYKHSIEWSDSEEAIGRSILEIDGKEPLGVATLVPARNVSSIRFQFRGKNIPVPKELWSDCFSPSLSPQNLGPEDVVHVNEAKGGIDLVVSLGDGAAGCQVTWKLRINGKHSRTLFTP